jgi:hypothetical protein
VYNEIARELAERRGNIMTTYRLTNYTTGEVYETACEVPAYACQHLYRRGDGQYRESRGTYRMTLINKDTGKVVAEWYEMPVEGLTITVHSMKDYCLKTVTLTPDEVHIFEQRYAKLPAQLFQTLEDYISCVLSHNI